MFPANGDVHLYKLSQIFNTPTSDIMQRVLFTLEREALCALGEDVPSIEAKMIASYQYMSDVLAYYHGICTMQDRTKNNLDQIDSLRRAKQITKAMAKDYRKNLEQNLAENIARSEQSIERLITQRRQALLELQAQAPTARAFTA